MTDAIVKGASSGQDLAVVPGVSGTTVSTGTVDLAQTGLPVRTPEVEARFKELASELRCLVCQNQTIADSHSGLAEDLRQQVREMLQQGRDEAQIRDYMTQRYGDFILYRPPMNSRTLLLWIGPGIILVGGLVALALALRRRNALPSERFESDDEAEPQDPHLS